MATGGTIPQDRKQYVTFYNTTGIIEKDKNIYFVPRFSKTATAGNLVISEWRNAFNSVCPPASNYTDIEISSWSPQDRTLRVQGNIDDFRIITSEGNCLNYLIIRRRVKKNNVFVDSFYAFFITNAKQAGGSSVELTLEPDYFTNVFYLHNNHLLTADDVANDYEPFNERMKNCYVNRQHYNRVELENVSRTLSRALSTRSSQTTTTVLYESDLPLTNFSYTEVSQTGSGTYSVSLVHTDKYRIVGEISSDLAGTLYSISLTLSFDEAVLTPANIEVFLNQKESYKYKYQYRDERYPIADSIHDSVFTDEEKQEIKNASRLSSLSESTRNKVIKTSLMYLCIETKSLEKVMPYNYLSTGLGKKYNLTGGNLEGGFNAPNLRILFPIFILPREFSHLEHRITFGFDFASSNYEQLGDFNIQDGISVLRTINTKATADFIYGAYLVKDACIPADKITISEVGSGNDHYVVNYSLDMVNSSNEGGYNDVSLKKGLYLVGLQAGLTSDPAPEFDMSYDSEHQKYFVTVVPLSAQTKYIVYSIGMAISGYDSRYIKLSLSENVPDLVNNYYDFVLETEPYSFYTISYMAGFEVDFKKERYFKALKNDIYLDYYYSINGMLKVSYVPYYTVEDKRTRYYNESLTFTLSPQFPLSSDSYSSYYYQNMAQMKNQFAVNDYNNTVDLVQHALISGPNAVGMSASKRGWVGALAETGNQVMQMANEGIDWAQSNKNIQMNQQAKLADMGAKPDIIKQVGSEIYYELKTGEHFIYLNHYTIDSLSYNSIAKLLERVGYEINLYDDIHAVDRVGWNYVRLNNFDFETAKITLAEEQAIKEIFLNGVTLLHDQSYLTSGHNYETILEGGN